MTLQEFRELTAHLDGDLELTCAGGDVAIVWHDHGAVSIDDGTPWLDDEDNATVLYERSAAIAPCLVEKGGATG